MTTRREYSTHDAAPAVLYAKRDPNADEAFPITPGMLTGGIRIPEHDTQIITEFAATSITTIAYTLSGSTVAVKTITVSGTQTTISISYV